MTATKPKHPAIDDDELDTLIREGLVGEGAINSSTDGKIVGLCPGCDKAIRRHLTPHGDELHHLHNNSVRCHGSLAEGAGEAAAADAVPGVAEAQVAQDVAEGIGHQFNSLTQPGDEWAWHHARQSSVKTAGDYLGRPDANNPTGRGADEYKARTWDAYQTTRPMQTPDDRNVNTPVLPADPIKTRNINTPTPDLHEPNDHEERDDDQEEDDE